jgi:hypothetical protein
MPVSGAEPVFDGVDDPLGAEVCVPAEDWFVPLADPAPV